MSDKKESSNGDATSIISELINKNNIIMLVWFLAIYFVITQVIGLSFGQENKHAITTSFFNVVTLIAFVGFIAWYLSEHSTDDAVRQSTNLTRLY